MTLRADLAALLDDAGIVDVDVDEAVADEHARVAAYLKVVAVAAAGSTSLPVLTILTESGRTRKIRNIARNRAAARAVRK